MNQPPGAEPNVDERLDARHAPILVVDDDVHTRQALEALLVDEGYTVVAAADGRQALTFAGTTSPALVILDITLPLLDGFEVAVGLRADHGDDVPIVAMSADGNVSEKARRMGAVAYLHKPFRLDHLVALVRRHARSGA